MISSKLTFFPALQRPDLLALPVRDIIDTLALAKVEVAEIDTNFMGGRDLCEHYGISPKNGANCVVVEVVRGQEKSFAACLLPVSCGRADFNGTVRRRLGARRVSLAPLDKVLNLTGMEYGSITAVGLPNDWPILIESSLAGLDRVIIGSGLQRSKLAVPGSVLLDLPRACAVEGMCR